MDDWTEFYRELFAFDELPDGQRFGILPTGRILRSPVAHGLIRGIDCSAARAMPGVRAVITGEDFAAPYGVIPIAQNEWPLARDKVRYRGLAKNATRSFVALALANIFLARRTLYGQVRA